MSANFFKIQIESYFQTKNICNETKNNNKNSIILQRRAYVLKAITDNKL